jgi:hypothetical protein
MAAIATRQMSGRRTFGPGQAAFLAAVTERRTPVCAQFGLPANQLRSPDRDRRPPAVPTASASTATAMAIAPPQSRSTTPSSSPARSRDSARGDWNRWPAKCSTNVTVNKSPSGSNGVTSRVQLCGTKAVNRAAELEEASLVGCSDFSYLFT